MKNVLKSIIALSIVLTFSMSVFAATGTVKKEGNYSKVSFKYTSYKTDNGVKAVKNGEVKSVKGVSALMMTSFYKSKKLKLIDGGRTYSLTVKMSVWYPFSNDHEEKTERYEFHYRKSY